MWLMILTVTFILEFSFTNYTGNGLIGKVESKNLVASKDGVVHI